MSDVDKRLFGMGLLHPITPSASGVLREKFLVPPFSVLNARDGVWQDRKRRWLSLGLEGEIGRGVNPGGSPMPSANYSQDGSRGDGRGKAFQAAGREERLTKAYTTSIFDPVLCELMYRWFCPEGGQVVDPFAGGSVRGIVSHVMGRSYWGCDLRTEQIEANEAQASLICPDNRPTWVVGDAVECLQRAPEADFIFSCPPYGHLERYSDDPQDLSNMGLDEFRRAYTKIIQLACERLKQDRFACFVVGDYRDSEGNYCNLPGGTIQVFRRAGLHLYNEAILVTAISSLSMRAKGFFECSRKLGKGHQNILVFVKGNGRQAAEYIKSKETVT